ncbi:MAG: transporter substrate-binding domain-containing protein [Gammaproteobacteria bacterium]
MAAILFLVSISSSAQVFLNRSYNTLERSKPIKGDFEEIIRYGKLRILLTQDYSSVAYLPRRRSPLAEQQRMAEDFALSHGLIPELIIVKNFAELIPALVAGKGDLIISNLTINEQRREKISFSVAVSQVREQVVVRKDDDSVTRVRDLNGKLLMVNRDSTFWDALQWLRENKYPDMEVLATPDNELHEQILDRLSDGEIDATILDSNLVEIYQSYRSDIKVATNFSGQRDIGWGIRRDAPRLVSAINKFLLLENVAGNDEAPFKGDFDQIRKRRILRVLLRNNASSYFLYRGELIGFEYELAQEFARYYNLRLEVVVPSSHKEMSSLLLEGRADMAMGFLEPSDSLRRLGIEYSQPYHYARQHIVVQKDDPATQISDLDFRTIAVRRNSAYWDTLSKLQQQGANFSLRAIDDDVETEQLIQQVASGRYEATMADEQILDIELARSVAVKSAFAVAAEIPHAIAVRARNNKLRTALDAFIKRTYKGEFYNVLYQKYFKSRRSVVKLARGRVIDLLKGQISPYDNLVQKYADEFGFDWRLITAQMFQESRFNPKARSLSGARGLMQLMPRTARSLGVKNIDRPDASIMAGIKYLDWLRDRFSDKLPVSERMWFSLAAYNAGVGHVRDAQRLAKSIGLDPGRWFSNAETAMLLLSQKKYASKARYGFINGEEPVNYVRDIKQRFEAYVELGGNLPSKAKLPGNLNLALR